MKRIKIRDMKKEDIPFILNFSNRTKELWASKRIRFPLDKDGLEVWLKNKEDDELLILDAEGEPIGFCIGILDYKAAQILFMGIKKEYKDRGLGSKLLAEFMKKMKAKGAVKFYLYVQTKNKSAIKFYKNFGFELGDAVYFMSKGW